MSSQLWHHTCAKPDPGSPSARAWLLCCLAPVSPVPLNFVSWLEVAVLCAYGQLSSWCRVRDTWGGVGVYLPAQPFWAGPGLQGGIDSQLAGMLNCAQRREQQ